MKLYRSEEVRRPTAKKPWEWCVYQLDDHRWKPVCGGQNKEIRDNWLERMCERALRLGTESAGGFYYTYFLVRESWPEKVIENLVARVEDLVTKVEDLESEMRHLNERSSTS